MPRADGRFKFEDPASLVDTGNLGQLTGIASADVTPVRGLYGGAALFDGTGYVLFSRDLGFGTRDFSIFFWYLPLPTGAGPYSIFSKSGGVGQESLDLRIDGDGYLTLHVWDTAHVEWTLSAEFPIYGYNLQNYVGFTRRGQTYALYVGGCVAAVGDDGPADIFGSEHYVALGQAPGIDPFEGILDNLEIFHEALEPYEVEQAVYREGLAKRESPAVLPSADGLETGRRFLPDEDTVYLYRFDEDRAVFPNLAPGAPAGSDLTAVNGALQQNVRGRAFAFSRRNTVSPAAYAQSASAVPIPTGYVNIEIWFRPYSILYPTYQVLLDHGYLNTEGYLIYIETSVQGKLTALFRSPNNVDWVLRQWNNFASQQSGEWYHVSATWVPSLFGVFGVNQLHVDGNDRGSNFYGVTGDVYRSANRPLCIGAIAGGVFPFNGEIAEVRIRSRHIATNDPSDIYRALSDAVAGMPLDEWTLHLWHFDDDTDDLVADSLGVRHGTIVGAPTRIDGLIGRSGHMRGWQFPGPGANHHLEFATHTDFNFTSNRCVECWFLIDDLTADRNVITRNHADTTVLFQIKVHSDGRLRLTVQDLGGNPMELVTATGQIVTDRLYHLVVNYEAGVYGSVDSNLSAILDGQHVEGTLSGESTMNPANALSSQVLVFGTKKGDNSLNMYGRLYDVRWGNRVRPLVEVLEYLRGYSILRRLP